MYHSKLYLISHKYVFFLMFKGPSTVYSACWNCGNLAQDKFQNFIFSLFWLGLCLVCYLLRESLLSLLVIKYRLKRSKSCMHLLSQQYLHYIKKAYFPNKRYFWKIKAIKIVNILYPPFLYNSVWNAAITGSFHRCAMQIKNTSVM